MFGSNLGTGDYGHITIEHASMLLRNFLSLREFTNQGFEATHSSQRLVYAKATSHDRHGHATSSKFSFKNLVNVLSFMSSETKQCCMIQMRAICTLVAN